MQCILFLKKSGARYLPIDEFATNTALEEARAAIAGENAIVFATEREERRGDEDNGSGITVHKVTHLLQSPHTTQTRPGECRLL